MMKERVRQLEKQLADLVAGKMNVTVGRDIAAR
jgi:hypothetical protein